ncbi:hypothetical protein Clacol_008609 [Clathrus columnatus]|uniref:Cytochrome P450 n=1 Tax=Clathrus columnatus TaxID=1419009 RepID=A0AAV5AND8_9AGAM|nr:hypothetical protein Clacol_008609 [Clathrus columnatus]
MIELPENLQLFLTNKVVLSGFGLAVAIVYLLLNRRLDKGRLPPGPRGLPIVGAVVEVPKEKEWITYYEWKKQYGPIVGLHVFGQRIVLLNTPKVVQEVLNSRNGIYSYRPPFPMLELMGFESWNVGVMQTGTHIHNLTRRLITQFLSKGGLLKCAEIQESEVKRFLKSLLHSPDEFFHHTRRFSAGVIMRCFYGIDANTKDGRELVLLNEEVNDKTSSAGSPAAYLVNTFPILKYWPRYFPGGKFHKDAEEGHFVADRLVNFPLELIKTGMEKPESPVSASFLQTNFDSSKESDVRSAALAMAATSYGAGTETTASVILSFFLAMVHFPEAQKAIQKELDKAFQGRLPTYADKLANHPPCVDAFVKECQRWGVTGTFGLPHFANKDDVIDGYVIPKGTIVMSNIWGILHDEKLYPDPSEFRHERFLGPQPQPDPKDHVYGYGRRICPGRNLAEGSLWLTVASVLLCFDILPVLSDSGKPQLPALEYTSGVMRRPKEFRCRIIPRSPLIKELIEHITL